MNYECHITVPRDQFDLLGHYIAHGAKWKISAIDGDPVLGKKAFAYLTTHSDSSDYIHDKMHKACKELTTLGVTILRKKIELIVYDELSEAGRRARSE